MKLHRLLTASLLPVLVFGGVSIAAADVPPLDRIESATQNIAAQLKNTSMRLKHTVSSNPQGGLRSGDALPGGVTTAMQECCRRNLEVIFDRMQTIAISAQELYDRHSSKEESEPAGAIAHLADTVKAMNRQLRGLAEANEAQYAEIQLKKLSQMFAHLREDINKYKVALGMEPGGGEASSDEAPAPEKKKKKKKS
jgi:hypothetical protein